MNESFYKKIVCTFKNIIPRKTVIPQTLVPSEYVQLLLQLVSNAIHQPGDILEVGVYKGGTLFQMARHIAEHHSEGFKGRHLIGIDTFEGHPYINVNKDPPHHFKGRFSDTSYETVNRYFGRFPFVRLIKGECGSAFQTLPADQRFCLVNLDVDIYDSYKRSIEYVYPRLSSGGVIVCDEYQGYGQKEFIDHFFAHKPVEIKMREGRAEGQNYGVLIFKKR